MILSYFISLVSMLLAIILILSFITAYLVYQNIHARTNYDHYGNKFQVVTRYKDKEKAADMLIYFTDSCRMLFPELEKYADSRFKKDIVARLKLFNPENLKESDPTWTIGHKAMTTLSGEINICLRNKDGSFMHRDLLYFVFLHELSHILTDPKYTTSTGEKVTDDHPREFWAVFKYLLIHAVRLRQIYPHEYHLYPDSYTGNIVDYNPYWDDMLNIVLDT